MSINSPVFIIGYPRSGTTLLLDFLTASRAFPVYNFDETHFFSHFYKRYGPLIKKKNSANFQHALLNSHWLIQSNISQNDLRNAIPADCTCYAKYLTVIMELISKRQGFNRWLEKTPWHLLYISEIVASIPKAKFILIIRDPRDVVLSIVKYGWAHGDLLNIARITTAWQWHMLKAKKDIARIGADVITVYYEDLVKQPRKVAKHLSEYLNLDIDYNYIENNAHGVLISGNSSFKEAPEINNDPVYRWKSHCNKKTIARIDYALGNSLCEYNYAATTEILPLPFYEKVIITSVAFLYIFLKNTKQILFPITRR